MSLIYAFDCICQAGVQIADPVTDVFNGQEVEVWSRITWSPKWALTFNDIKKKVNERSSVSQRSTLVVNGQNVFLEALSLDGTLIINSIDEAKVFQLFSSNVSLLGLIREILQCFICLKLKFSLRYRFLIRILPYNDGKSES